MIIEIKPRQSGKTTRLIENVVDYIYKDKSNSVIVFVHTFDRSQYLKRLIQDKFNEISFRSNKNEIKNIMSTRINVLVANEQNHLGIGYSSRRFYDEFGLCDYVEWRNNDYYTTSEHNVSSHCIIED